MKKFTLLAAVAAFAAAPAFASKITVEFAADEGDAVTVVFDQESMTATSEEGTAPYTYDAEAHKICVQAEEGEICADFEGEAEEPTVGYSTGYTATDGETGTATITAIE